MNRNEEGEPQGRAAAPLEASGAHFESLVRLMEEQARSTPAAYRRKVMLVTLLGSTYLATVVVLVLAFLGGMVWYLATGSAWSGMLLNWIFALGGFLLLVLRSLWVRVIPPDGLEIKTSDAPELFALIEQLRRQLDAPTFHRVLLTSEFNAGVVQLDRLGPFGWQHNYLCIGLPLLSSLSTEQFKCVLAHEIGHVSRNHGRLSNWIYRQRIRWGRLMQNLEATNSLGRVLFTLFLRHYAPYFRAISFPLARANEYDADGISVRLTSPSVAAEALTTLAVVGSYLEECYWPSLLCRANDDPEPTITPFHSMATALAGGLERDAAQRWLKKALEQETNLRDTHPALAERLRAIGAEPSLALLDPGSAAGRLLGDALEKFTNEMDQRWQKGVKHYWESRYEEVQEWRRKCATLDARADARETLLEKDANEPSNRKLELVKTLPGSPPPVDLSEPHMPDVGVMSDMDLLFSKARSYSAPDSTDVDDRTKARFVVIVTPERTFLPVPMLDPDRVPEAPEKFAKGILHREEPLSIVVVAFTKLEALVDKGGVSSVETMNRSIPFLGFLNAFAYAGHTVVVFEGHHSAFEAGIRNSDVLLIDSAMLPFLQADWATVAFGVMATDARILIHERKSYSLLPVVRAKNEAGWCYGEPDGEGSYANCLLTLMTSAPKMPVCIVAGSPLPDLAQINTDASQTEWVANLPFRYDQLNAEQVMDILLRPAGRGLLGYFTGVRTLRGELVTSGGKPRDVSFKLSESRSKDGKRQLVVERK